MDSYKYYLISYYARLPMGGFGFGRLYYSRKGLFNLKQFEEKIVDDSNGLLKINDISLISRINISVEEYLANKEKSNPEEETNQLDMGFKDGTTKDESVKNADKDLRTELAEEDCQLSVN